MASNPFARDLDRTQANHQPLTPLTFLERAAAIYPDRIAVVHGAERQTYASFYARTRRLAAALAGRGIAKGDTVAAMLANTPPMLEAHYAVPMTGGVLLSLNTRLDAAIIAFQLDHGEAKADFILRASLVLACGWDLLGKPPVRYEPERALIHRLHLIEG